MRHSPRSRQPPFLSALLAVPFFVLATASTSAHAAPQDAALAEGLFTSAKEAMARGDLQTACTRFGESLKLDPAIGTLLNLATCEERSGKLTAALDHFKSARSQLPKDDFRVKFTTEQIEGLEHRIAHVTLRLPAGSPGARVMRDGVQVAPASLDSPLAIDPGAHVIMVESAGAPASRTDLTLHDGEEKVLDLTVGKASTPGASAGDGPAAAEGDAAAPSKTLAFVVTGVGIAGIAVGAVTGILAIGAASTYRDHCTNGACDPDGLSAASTGKTMSLVSPIAFAVGVVGLGVGAYLFFSSPKGSKPSTALVPLVSPSLAGLSMEHTF